MCEMESKLPQSSDMFEMRLAERFNKVFSAENLHISNKNKLFLLLCSEMPNESLQDLYRFCDEVYENVKKKYI